MELRWHLAPDDVAFNNVETKERDCPGTDMKGCYRPVQMSHDDSAPWTGYKQDNDGIDPDQVLLEKGATQYNPIVKWYGYDNAQNYEAGGGFQFEIPWNWRVKSMGNIKGTGKNIQKNTITEDGGMTIEKLGKSTNSPAPFQVP